MRANPADQSLRQDSFQRRGNQERLHAHVDQPRDRAGGVVRVQRAENLVARERGANRDLRRLRVANFTHHDHVRILAQNRAQTRWRK